MRKDRLKKLKKIIKTGPCVNVTFDELQTLTTNVGSRYERHMRRALPILGAVNQHSVRSGHNHSSLDN
jgi:hypothetical protein